MNSTDAAHERVDDGRPVVLCDWGGSQLRAFLQVDGDVIARRNGPGIGALVGTPLAALRETVLPWRGSPGFSRIVMCGMVGSRNGIVEVPYVRAPVAVAAWASQGLEHETEEYALLIGAGIRGLNASGAAEVMRGEETQVFGAIECLPSLKTGRHTLVLPGTHSKWVQISEGRITSFQTYITGELYALLRDHSSLLRAGDSDRSEQGGFAKGLTRTRMSSLTSALFETRAAQLTGGKSPTWAREFLSGLLIGDEVETALRASTPAAVVLIGEGPLASLYHQALIAHDIAVQSLDADRCVIAGLRLLAAQPKQVHSS